MFTECNVFEMVTLLRFQKEKDCLHELLPSEALQEHLLSQKASSNK